MQINNSSFNYSVVPHSKAAKVDAKNSGQSLAGVNDRVNKAEQALEAEKQVNQQHVNQQKAQKQNAQQHQVKEENRQSFELDEATIAYYESNASPSQLAQHESATDILTSDDSAKSFAKGLPKDNISSQNQSAVSSYQSIGNLAQRESVQQLLGIDLFA